MPGMADYLLELGRRAARAAPDLNPAMLQARGGLAALEAAMQAQRYIDRGVWRTFTDRPTLEEEPWRPEGTAGKAAAGALGALGLATFGSVGTAAGLAAPGLDALGVGPGDLAQQATDWGLEQVASPTNVAFAAAEPLQIVGKLPAVAKVGAKMGRGITAGRKALESIPYAGPMLKTARRALTYLGDIEDYADVQRAVKEYEGQANRARRVAAEVSDPMAKVLGKYEPGQARLTRASQTMHDILEGLSSPDELRRVPGLDPRQVEETITALNQGRGEFRTLYPRLYERATGKAFPGFTKAGYAPDLREQYLLEGLQSQAAGTSSMASKVKAQHLERLRFRSGKARAAPDYLTSRRPDIAAKYGLEQEGLDVARLDLGQKVRDTPGVSKVFDFRQQAQAAWGQLGPQIATLKGHIAAARGAMTRAGSANRPLAPGAIKAMKRQVQALKDQYRQALAPLKAQQEAWLAANPDYVLVPKDAAWAGVKRGGKRGPKGPDVRGPLAGYGPHERVAVKRDVYEFLSGMFKPVEETSMGRLGRNLLKMWKTGVTILRPGAHGRQAFSNFAFGPELINRPPESPATLARMAEVFNILEANDDRVKMARDLGIVGSDTQIAGLVDEWLAPLRKASLKKDATLIDVLNDKIEGALRSGTVKKLAGAWSRSDDVVKFMGFLDRLDEGYEPIKAADWVAQRLPVASRTPNLIADVSTGRLGGPLAPPFAGFQYHSARILKNLVTTPEGQLKLAKWALYSWLLERGAEEAMRGTMTPEQLAAVREDPQRLLQGLPVGPNAEGGSSDLDMTYVNPFADWAKAIVNVLRGDPGQALHSQFSNPLWAAFLDVIVYGKDSFTGRELYRPEDVERPLGKVRAAAMTTAKKLAPPLLVRDLPLVAQGAARDLGATATAGGIREMFNLRDQKTAGGALVGDVAGIRIVPGDVQKAREDAEIGLRKRIGELRAAARRVNFRERGGAISAATREATRERLRQAALQAVREYHARIKALRTSRAPTPAPQVR